MKMRELAGVVTIPETVRLLQKRGDLRERNGEESPQRLDPRPWARLPASPDESGFQPKAKSLVVKRVASAGSLVSPKTTVRTIVFPEQGR